MSRDISDFVLDIPENFRDEDELKQLNSSDDVSKLRSVLDDGEIVLRLVVCFHEDSDGVLAATNKRIIFADKRFITSKVVSYSYSEVAALIYDTELVTHTITLVHKSGSLTLSQVDRDHGSRFIDMVGDIIGQDYVSEGKSGRVLRHRAETIDLEELDS